MIDNLKTLFSKWSGEHDFSVNVLPPSGSSRDYFRIRSKKLNAIGVINHDYRENLAFLAMSRHFFDKGLHVPRIYAEDIDKGCYILEDLGDVTLYKHYRDNMQDGTIGVKTKELYFKALEELVQFQVIGGDGMNYDICYPRSDFDKQSMLWDLNYFKYHFLKLMQIPFDEQKLENDFNVFTDFLLKENTDYFMYRDFQSRNIMVYDDKLYFIDYQGGRRGALQYDLASLLFEAKTFLPFDFREQLLNHYMNVLENHINLNKKQFLDYFYAYALIRLLQAFGAYGYRGLYEKKQHFIDSIPYGVKNLQWIINNYELPVDLPELKGVLKKIIALTNNKAVSFHDDKLNVVVNSFSFKKGIPGDATDNGGGHVFDCRALPNPGRLEKYQASTGMDEDVKQFFKDKTAMHKFLENVYAIVDQSVDNYLEREFLNLQVSFGCTGGQHRSVYAAERLKDHLQHKYSNKIHVIIHHVEQIK